MEILAALLGVERVGADDNFFLLGFHSLLATQVAVRVYERFGIQLSLRHLFEAKTVARLAAEVGSPADGEAQLDERSKRSLVTWPASSGRNVMDADISLCQLMEPEVMASPYGLYRELREADPVHWDPFLHAWVVTRYADIVTVLSRFSADRTLTPEKMDDMGLGALNPIIEVMSRQMLFRDPPAHTRLRNLCAAAFTPARVAILRGHIQDIADSLIDSFIDKRKSRYRG